MPKEQTHFDTKLLAEDLDGSFQQLVHVYQRQLYGFVFRQVGSVHDAEDITQEAFIRAYFALKTYPSDRVRTLKLQSWLYKITLNVLYNYTQTSRLQFVSLDFSETYAGFDRADQSPGPEEEIGWREHRRELEDLIAKLPPRYGLAVNLRYFEDLSYQEITVLLHQPLGTVKSNVHRGVEVTALTDEDPAVQEAALLVLRQHYPPAARTMVSCAGYVIEQEDVHQASWETIASEPVAERQSPSIEIDVYSNRVPLLNRAFSKRKRWLWCLLESAVATLLLISSFFSWLALTRYLSPAPADVHLVQTPTEQTMFPLIQPGKILLTYHGDKRVSTSQWTADSRYLGVSNDSALTPNQYVNGGEYIQIWNAATGTLTKRLTLPSLPPHAQGLFFFEADRYLLLLSNQGLLQIWDYVSGQKLLDITSPGAHGWPDWRGSKDQRWLAISSPKNHQVEIWDIIHRKQIASYPASIAPNVAWQWSPDDRYLAGLAGNGELVVWNAFTGNVVLNVPRENGASLFWSPDSQKLVVTQPANDQMQFWNVLSRKQVLTFSGVAQRVQWTNNGERMLADERTSLVIWDTQTGQAMATLSLSAKAWATVSPDGISIAYAPGDNTLQIWDAIRGRMVARYDGFVGKGQLLTASWSPDSRILAALGGNGVLLLWKASTGTAVAAYSVPLFPMPGLIWSPNAKYIVLTSQQPVFAIVEPGK